MLMVHGTRVRSHGLGVDQHELNIGLGGQFILHESFTPDMSGAGFHANRYLLRE
jgi:hypothetical protein